MENKVIKKNLEELLKNYKPYISTANVMGEPYLMFKEKCRARGLKITRALAGLMQMFIDGEVEF